MSYSIAGVQSDFVPSVEPRRICIVIPTYNEAGNIGALITCIREHTAIYERENSESIEILVVDDSSPDGTADRVRELQRSDSRLHLMVRSEKNGLGEAYKAGMARALEFGADVIFEMDADHSHDPRHIPQMLERLQTSDVVIGSRYVEGGSVPDHWPAKRRAISWLSNAGARSVLGLWHVRDCSGGYRAIRRSVLERVDLKKVKGSGYGFQLGLLYRAHRAGFRITEVPIHFADRSDGESKMRLSDWFEMGYLVCSLRLS